MIKKNCSFFLIFLITVCQVLAHPPKAAIEKNEIIKIPFEYVEGLIVIKAKVNGIEGRFLFDNGASYSCLNKDFAKKSRVSFRQRTTITDGNNKRVGILKGSVKKIEIDKAIFSKTIAYLIDTKRFFPCDPVDGIIGASIINAVNWKIDFEKQQMLLSLKPFEEEGQKLKIKISSNNSSFINFNIDRQPIRTKVDFGFKGELKILKKRGFSLLRNKKSEKAIGISSLSVSGLGKIDTIYTIYRTSKLNYTQTPLKVNPKITLTEHLKYDARIGLDYFKNYQLIVNSSRNEYILKHLNKDVKTQEKSYGVRIYMVKGKYKVIQLKPNENFSSPIRLMDEVTHIDQKSVTDFSNLCAFKEYIDLKADREESFSIRLKNSKKSIKIPYKTSELRALN